MTIDVLTKRPSDGAFVLVLVEEGPWRRDRVEAELRRLQNRLYDYVDAAIDGHLAARFPDARGQPVVIRLNCFDTPDRPVREFFERFAEHIRTDADIQRDLVAEGWVRSLVFEYNWRSLRGGAEPGSVSSG